ncbi:MAG: pseudouridine synthase [Candidatus Methylophosphatis roskildensis]
MSRRPTLKLPAKPRAEKTRSGTVRPNAPRPKRTGGAPQRVARQQPSAQPAAPEDDRPPRSVRPSEPARAPRTSESKRTADRPRRPWPDQAPRKSRDDAWPDKRAPRTSQPARAQDDGPPRPARQPRPKAPSGAASGGGRSEARRYTDRAADETRGSRSAPRAERSSATRTSSPKRTDTRGYDGKAGDKPRHPRPPETRKDARGRPAAARETLPPRKPSSPELPRLSKRMSELGLCSRREADEWIENGWVRVDGKVVETLGTRVHPNAKITVEEAARQHQSETVTILLHKPVGYVSGQAEDGHEPAAVLIRPETRWDEDRLPLRFKRGHLRGLAPAGRLDIDSAGLLVFTQDGRIARRLVGEDSNVEKEYLVRVEGTLDERGLALLNHGLALDERKLKPAHVSWQNEHQLRFVLREGRKRQIRRMCELVGLTVTGLKRIRIGSVTLSKLPLGTWRYLRPDETF